MFCRQLDIPIGVYTPREKEIMEDGKLYSNFFYQLKSQRQRACTTINDREEKKGLWCTSGNLVV